MLSLLLLAAFACSAYGTGEGLDRSKYITVDEIRPGMEAYCLTVYKGTQIEKFDLNVLDVVRDWRAGKDGILVRSTDERFVRTGPVAGCSGSPVYIDGRLAGALAWGTIFSKDPFYIARGASQSWGIPLILPGPSISPRLKHRLQSLNNQRTKA
jgi:hypothetical protein